ncbi:hypothetical protein FJZ18_03360 [Candidatus Pacearchaeota archaeon]|nr:hypothetical protein [Candidatus Pacearchaeota archaeon]
MDMALEYSTEQSSGMLWQLKQKRPGKKDEIRNNTAKVISKTTAILEAFFKKFERKNILENLP